MTLVHMQRLKLKHLRKSILPTPALKGAPVAGFRCVT